MELPHRRVTIVDAEGLVNSPASGRRRVIGQSHDVPVSRHELATMVEGRITDCFLYP